MKLSLTLNGEEKTFESKGLTMRASVAAFELMKKLEQTGGDYTQEQMDEAVDFVVVMFGEQFTADELWDGLSDSFYHCIPAMLRSMIQGVTAAIQSFPVNPTTTAAARTTKG